MPHQPHPTQPVSSQVPETTPSSTGTLPPPSPAIPPPSTVIASPSSTAQLLPSASESTTTAFVSAFGLNAHALALLLSTTLAIGLSLGVFAYLVWRRRLTSRRQEAPVSAVSFPATEEDGDYPSKIEVDGIQFAIERVEMGGRRARRRSSFWSAGFGQGGGAPGAPMTGVTPARQLPLGLPVVPPSSINSDLSYLTSSDSGSPGNSGIRTLSSLAQSDHGPAPDDDSDSECAPDTPSCLSEATSFPLVASLSSDIGDRSLWSISTSEVSLSKRWDCDPPCRKPQLSSGLPQETKDEHYWPRSLALGCVGHGSRPLPLRTPPFLQPAYPMSYGTRACLPFMRGPSRRVEYSHPAQGSMALNFHQTRGFLPTSDSDMPEDDGAFDDAEEDVADAGSVNGASLAPSSSSSSSSAYSTGVSSLRDFSSDPLGCNAPEGSKRFSALLDALAMSFSARSLQFDFDESGAEWDADACIGCGDLTRARGVRAQYQQSLLDISVNAM